MAKNWKNAKIWPILGHKISKNNVFKKNSSRASRYHVEEDPDPFTAIIDYFYTSY